MTSTGLKKTVLKALEPKGTISKIKDKMSEILPYKLRIAIKTGKEVIGNVVGMITIPAQDIKDTETIVSLYSFHENILQGHDDRLVIYHNLIKIVWPGVSMTKAYMFLLPNV